MFEKFKKLKRKDIDTESIVDSWLFEYHGTTMEEVSKGYTKNKDGEYDPADTSKFYNDYAITQEQHDEWEDMIYKVLPKKLGMSKNLFERSWAMTRLNCAPSIKQ